MKQIIYLQRGTGESTDVTLVPPPVNEINMNRTYQYYPGLYHVKDEGVSIPTESPRDFWDRQTRYGLEFYPITDSGFISIIKNINQSTEQVNWNDEYKFTNQLSWTGFRVYVKVYSYSEYEESDKFITIPANDTPSGVILEPDWGEWTSTQPTLDRSIEIFNTGVYYYKNTSTTGICAMQRYQFVEPVTETTTFKAKLTIQRKNGDYFLNQMPITVKITKNE